MAQAMTRSNTQSKTQTTTQSLRRAAELRALGRLDEAEQICDAVLAAEPEAFDALHRLCQELGAVAQRSRRQD